MKTPLTLSDPLIETLGDVVGRNGVLADPAELMVYECDGLPQHKILPRAVVFPRSTAELSGVVRALTAANVSFAPRGAGTGLSGGALARDRGVVIELARMRRLLEIDPENRLARVETGFVNAHLSRVAAPHNLYYAPDPSSQVTCTIGGNIAENAGGIHCLKYGMTVDHVLAARVVMPDGEIVDLCGEQAVGYDLLGLFIGSEGTFGIATEATLRLTPLPPAVRTLLADFTDVDQASRAVSAIIAAGLVPAALEMVDGATIRAVEASVFAAGLPLDAEAALLIELDGLEAGLDAEAAQAEEMCRTYGARSVRRASDEYERKKLWAARKGAFGAMGRIAPDIMLQDAVVPRSRLPEVLAATYRTGARLGLKMANVFHAGDGNLHPFICFDSRDPEQVKRVKEAGREIMETCVRAGGTITGEHGVGLDKSEYLPLIFSDDDLEIMLRVRAAFDPRGLCNPGKVIPTLRSCGEARGAAQKANALFSAQDTAPHISSPTPLLVPEIAAASSVRSVVLPKTHDARTLLATVLPESCLAVAEDGSPLAVTVCSIEEAREVLRVARTESWRVGIEGAGSWKRSDAAQQATVILKTTALAQLVEHEPADLVATAQVGLSLMDFNRALGRAQQWLPLDPPAAGRATLGGVAATGLGGAQAFGYGLPRSHVIGMRVLLADGRLIKAGGRVVKNVAGYDLCKLFVGSYGTLGMITELTFKLRPRPARETSVVICSPRPERLCEIARSILDGRYLLPVAIELLSPLAAVETSATLSSSSDFALAVRFAGTAQATEYQTDILRGIAQQTADLSALEIIEDDEALWRALTDLSVLSQEAALQWRAQVRPSSLPELIALLNQETAPARHLTWHAGLGDGRLRVAIEAHKDHDDLRGWVKTWRRAIAKAKGPLIIEAAPAGWNEAASVKSNAHATVPLLKRIKHQIDPENIFPSRSWLRD